MEDRHKLYLRAIKKEYGISSNEELIEYLIENGSIPSCFGEGVSYVNCLKCAKYEFCAQAKALPKTPCSKCAYLNKRKTCGVNMNTCNSKIGWNRLIDRSR